jgi:hypothetical protein
MFHEIDRGPTYRKDVFLHPGQLVVKTVSFDDACIANTTAHRRNESVRTGDKFAVHDDAPIVYHFQAEQSSWDRFKKLHRDIYRALQSTDHVIREKAASTVAALHPEWVVAAPNARSIM